MITAVRHFYPAMGKAPELGAALTEWVRGRQSDGVETALLRRVYGSEPVHFDSITRHASLDALQERTKQTQQGDAFRAFQERLSGLLASPSTAYFYEVITPVPSRSGAPAPNQIVVRRRFRPAIGKGGALGRLLTEWTEHIQKEGHRAGLQRRILADDGPSFVATEIHESLGTYGKYLETIRGTDAFRAAIDGINPLLEEQFVARLFEIVVPFAS